MSDPGQTAPYDELADAGLVGCAVASHAGYLLAASRVVASDLFNPAHRRLFEACEQLAELDGTNIDTRDKRVERAAVIAGVRVDVLRRILDNRPVATDKNGTLARRVKSAADGRRVMAFCADLYNRLGAGEPVEVVLADLEPVVRLVLTGSPT